MAKVVAVGMLAAVASGAAHADVATGSGFSRDSAADACTWAKRNAEENARLEAASADGIELLGYGQCGCSYSAGEANPHTCNVDVRYRKKGEGAGSD